MPCSRTPPGYARRATVSCFSARATPSAVRQCTARCRPSSNSGGPERCFVPTPIFRLSAPPKLGRLSRLPTCVQPLPTSVATHFLFPGRTSRASDGDQAMIRRREGDVLVHGVGYGYSTEFSEYARTLPIEPGRGTAAGRALLECQIIHI